MITLRPYAVKHAAAWVRRVHRRLPKMEGALWCVAAFVGDEMRGLAVVGRPNARLLDVKAGEPYEVLQVVRVAVLENTRNACSALYGACARAARAMGALGIFTYIHDDESGVTLRAAGWVEDHVTAAGEWDRVDRQRELALEPGKKRRFWAPWSEAVRASARGAA